MARLLDAKAQCGLSFDEIASRLDYTNLYVAQLLLNQVNSLETGNRSLQLLIVHTLQAQLKPTSAERFAAVLPHIAKADLKRMQVLAMVPLSGPWTCALGGLPPEHFRFPGLIRSRFQLEAFPRELPLEAGRYVFTAGEACGPH